MNFIIFFAPKFKGFGVDLFKKMLSENPSLKLIAICTGGPSIVDFVKSNIPKESIAEVYDLEAEELFWLNNSSLKIEKLGSIDDRYGLGTFGEVISADRRIGAGFVRGGLNRPDIVGRKALIDNIDTPIVYVKSIFCFLENIFNRYKIEGVFCYAVAGAPSVAIAKVCNCYKLPFFTINTTRIEDNFIVDFDYKGRLKEIENLKFSDFEASDECTSKAISYLDSYRKKPTNPGYMNYNYSLLKKNRLPYFIKEVVKYSGALFLKPFMPEKHKSKLSFLKLKRKMFDLKLELNKLRFNVDIFDDNLPEHSYFYYPLHVDPEASTMVMSPMHTDQISIIESIAKGLPDDAILVVKEHWPMLGKRPKGFYQTLSRMPRVKLLSPFLDSRDVIKGAEATIVITGTAALEALLLERKAVVIGSSPYLAMGTGLVYEPSMANISYALERVKQLDKPDDRNIVKYLSCVFSLSFEMKSSLLWGDYNKHSHEEKDKALSSIVNKIMKKLNER